MCDIHPQHSSKCNHLVTVADALVLKRISTFSGCSVWRSTQRGSPLSYNHQAKEYAEKLENAIWIDQFKNTTHSYAHFISTEPEIWEQTKGEIDDFVCATGTGGTLAGVGKYLKERSNGRAQIWLVDSPASVLYEYVTSGGNFV